MKFHILHQVLTAVVYRIRAASSLLALGALTLATVYAEPVEVSGVIAMRALNCFNPEPHDHDMEFVLVEDGTQRLVNLIADEDTLSLLQPDRQVRVTGFATPQAEASIDGEGVEGQTTPTSPIRLQQVQVESIDILPQLEGAEAEAPEIGGGANNLEMLSCLLIFADTNTHSSMTSVTNATNLLFNNPTNANEAMQAVTKGRFGLQLGNGTGVPEDHIIQIQLDVNSSDVVGTYAMESLIRQAVFGSGPGQLGINQGAYNRILIFPPGGYPNGPGGPLDRASFTAYAYIHGPVGSTGIGRVSVYGSSYGNNRMNGYIHELGHNFGFRHSSKGTSEYGDRTCIMGTSNDATRTEAYGAAKLMSTNWLDVFTDAGVTLTQDATINLYPLSSDLTGVEETVGIAISGTDHYVAYHRNDLPYGYLSQSGDRDRVFVYTNPSFNTRTYQVANLSEGTSYDGPVAVQFGAYGPNNEYATVSIDVADGNTMPTVPEVWGTGQNQAVVLNFPATDVDGDSVSYATLTNPANGTLSGSYPNITYTPNTDFIGSDSFRITASDHLISNFITVTVMTFVDTDGDGLDDEWELQYFGNLSQGPNDDPDGDGETNLTEFQNGTDPTRAPTLFSTKLTGTIIGTDGAYGSSGFTKERAFDEDLGTYYDAANPKGDWVGLDFGSPKRIGLIKYAGRDGWGFRLEGGMFQASNSPDFSSGVEILYTISGWGVTGTLADVPVDPSASYRYVRYIGSDSLDNYNCAAELEFYEDGAPNAPTGLTATLTSGGVNLDWDDNSEPDLASYKVYRGTSPDTFEPTPIATGLTSSTYADDSVVNNNTYYYFVSAVDADGYEGANSNEASVEYVINEFAPVVNAGDDQTVAMTGDAVWTPALMTTAVWYDASDVSTITASGGGVSQWADKSGNANHAVQETVSKQPNWSSNQMSFDGGDILRVSNDAFNGMQNPSVIAVTKRDVSTGWGNSIASWRGEIENGWNLRQRSGNATEYTFTIRSTSAADDVLSGSMSALGVTHMIAAYRMNAATRAARINGTETLRIVDTGTINYDVGYSAIGGRFNNSTATNEGGYLTGSIYELIVIDGISDEDAEKLEGYLAHKWGLAGNLPEAHPYKAAPPGGAGATAELDGTVSDADGNPLTTIWTKVSGPGSVGFADASQVDTTANFSEAGVYVLRITADDGVFQTYDELTVTVTEAGTSLSVLYSGNGSNGGGVPVDGNSPYEENATVTVLGNTGSLTRTGYTFANWNTAANGTGTPYAPGATFTITGATTLYAQWTPNSYTVTFDKQGGSGGSDTVSATFDAPLPAATAPTRADYTFLGYYTQPAGAGVQIYDAGMEGQSPWSIAAGTTLYADWAEELTVSVSPDQNATLGEAGLWSPTAISAAAWYDATDADSIVHTGGAVAQWLDKSGNDNHAIQNTAAVRPTTGSQTLGGLNAIAFRIGDGSNKQFLSATDHASLNLDAAGGANVFAVMRYLGFVDNGSGLNVALGKGTILSSSSAYGLRISLDDGLGYKAALNGDVNTTAYANQEILFSGTGDAIMKVAKVYVDGTLRNSASTTEAFTSDNSSPLNIGRDASTGRYAEVDFGEILVVGGALSDEERERIEGYLAHKWGRQGSLPVGHPYKSDAPLGVGAEVSLTGSVTAPEGATLTTLWTLESGPAPVVFADPSAVDTTVLFTEAGTYVLRLTADDGVTQSYQETTITIFADESAPPAAPTGLSATPGDSQIALEWDAHADPDVVSYTVYRSQGAGSNGFVVIASGLISPSFVDLTAPNDVTYLYQVTATKSNDAESLPGDSVSAAAEGPLLVSQGPDGLLYKPYANEGQTNVVNTVPDYSRAGYMGGGVEIPFVPASVTLSPSGGDDTVAIQNAINTVSALPLVDGFRGAVLLTAGEYTVSSTLAINASGVVIRGQGQQASGGTRITYTATTQSNLFHFHGSANPSYVGSSARNITDSYVPVGSFTLNVTDASPFAPGDLVLVRNKMNQQWIDDIGMTEAGGLLGAPDDPAWDPASFQVSHYRYVVAVDGNQLTLDAPITQTIENQYGGGEVLKYNFAGAIENVGIENIRLESTYAAEDDEAHGWVAVEMRRVKNGWARQVTARYFGMGLILIDDFSQFITVEDCAMLDPKSITTGGRKFSFNIDDSTYILIQRNFSRGARHDYASGSLTPGPNVFVDNLATGAIEDIGPHFRYATAELYDNIKTDNSINVQNRLNAGTSHGWSGAQIMIWNVEANSIICDAPTGAMNWSIGAVGTKSPSPSFMAPDEPFGIWQSHNAHVTPRSLYYAQLRDRQGLGAVREVIVPEQDAGTIWTQLESWAGDGRFLDGVIGWLDPEATIMVNSAIGISARIRDLNVLENLVSVTWSKVSGPGNVSFGDAALLQTTASFDTPGIYVLHLTADNGSQQVSGTLEVEIIDPDYVAPPAAPQGLVATAGDGFVALDWADNAEADVTYSVRRSTTSGGGFTTIHTTAADATGYTDSGLEPGTTYYYQVIATNGGGDSAASNEASATTFTETEAWRDQYFDQTEGTGDAADDYDYDGDGIPNLLERAFGTSPTDSSSRVPMPEGQMVEDGGSDYMTLSYRRLTGGSGTTGVNYTAGGITYTVEYDGDLTPPWSSGGVVQVGNAIDNGDGTETVTVRLSTPVSSDTTQFMRLKVTPAP